MKEVGWEEAGMDEGRLVCRGLLLMLCRASVGFQVGNCEEIT